MYPQGTKYIYPKSGYIFSLPNETYSNIRTDDCPIISIDINGYKKPNIEGIDIFLFIFDKNGKLLPYGSKNYKELGWELPYWYGPSSCCSINSKSCAYYAIINTHPTKPQKDYWNDFLSESK